MTKSEFPKKFIAFKISKIWLGMVAYAYNPSYLGGWGRKITWTWEVKVAVSQDHAIALQPGQQEWNSISKKGTWYLSFVSADLVYPLCKATANTWGRTAWAKARRRKGPTENIDRSEPRSFWKKTGNKEDAESSEAAARESRWKETSVDEDMGRDFWQGRTKLRHF